MATFGPFKVPTPANYPLLINAVLDAGTSNVYIVIDADFEIDWGNGFVQYPAGYVYEPAAAGPIVIRSSNQVTSIRLSYRFASIEIVRMDDVTTMSYGLSSNPNLTSIVMPPTSQVSNMDGLFRGCSSLQTLPATLDFSSTSSLRSICADCSSLTSFPLLDTSGITNMQFSWSGCSSLSSFPLLDTSGVTDFWSAWANCSSLTSFPLIDTSSAINLWSAWSGCSGLTSFPQIDTSSVTNLQAAWAGCSGLTGFPLINTALATDMSRTWENCSGLTSFPQIDTSSVTNLQAAWAGCSGLTGFPLINTALATDMSRAWENCSGLTSFPQIDTSSVTNLQSAWENCSSLTNFPLIDTSSVTNLRRTWSRCRSLTSFPQIDTSSVQDFYAAWWKTEFGRMPALDYSSATILSYALWSEKLSCIDHIDTTGVPESSRVDVIRIRGCISDPDPNIQLQITSATGHNYTSAGGAADCQPFCSAGFVVSNVRPSYGFNVPYPPGGGAFRPISFGASTDRSDIVGFGTSSGWTQLTTTTWLKIIQDDGAGNRINAKIEDTGIDLSYRVYTEGSASLTDIGIFDVLQDICAG